MIIMAKINKYWGYVAIGALTAAAAGAVAALIAKKGSCKEDFDFEDDFDEKLKKLLIQTILRSLPIKLLKLRLKMQKRKKMPMNLRLLKRLWTLHLNLKNKRYRSQ